MKSAAKKISIPTLEERVVALRKELEEALEALAAERKALTDKGAPEGGAMPQATFRRMMDAKGFGDCLCRSLLIATKENS
jgi:hypothetical protein